MQPAQCDIQIYRGDYFEMTLRLREGTINGATYAPGAYLDLTGWQPKAEIRATRGQHRTTAGHVHHRGHGPGRCRGPRAGCTCSCPRTRPLP